MTPEAEVRLVQAAKAGNKAAEKIILDPLSYTSHPFLPASTLARVLVNGV